MEWEEDFTFTWVLKTHAVLEVNCSCTSLIVSDIILLVCWIHVHICKCMALAMDMVLP